MRRAIKDLQKDTDIVILPANKGNVTVVMDRTEYVKKMNDLLEDETYIRLKNAPTFRVESKVNQALKTLENKGLISNKERKSLSPQCSTSPQIYGLPKVHKENIPLCPIVSAISYPGIWQASFPLWQARKNHM